MIIEIHIDHDTKDYIESCARIRDVTVTRLLKAIVEKVCEDQLVLAVLDDDSQPFPARRGQRKFHPMA